MDPVDQLNAGTTHSDGHRHREALRDAHAVSPYFTGVVLDGTRSLLEASYRLRYQVYCLERQFLPAADHPDGLEIDAFDRHSVHLGVLNTQGDVIATARLVQPGEAGLPLFHHCQLFTGAAALDDPARRPAEVSRLCVSKTYNRRAGDGFYSLQGAAVRPGRSERREGGEIVMALYKALYQASKRRGFTHWFAATERSLQRLLARYGCPFRAVGPETDYYGHVTPYMAALHEWDEVILSRRIALLDDFLTGLEPQFRPVADEACLPTCP